MGWFKEWLDERRRVKMKRVEVGSIPRVWLGTLAILLGLVAVALVCAAYMVAHSTGRIIEANPEVGMAALGAMGDMDHGDTTKLAALSILKQVSASADVQGHVKGHFVSKEVRRMEKMNLSCVDAYTYYELTMGKATYPRDLEIAKDRGGAKYAKLNGTAFIKVPQHNCAMREYSTPTTADIVMDDFEVRRVQASYSGPPR